MKRTTTEPLAVILASFAGLWAVPELTLLWLAASIAGVVCIPLASKARAGVIALSIVAAVTLGITAERHRQMLMEWRATPTDTGAPGTFTGEAPGFNGPLRLRLQRDVAINAETQERMTSDHWTLIEGSDCAVARPRGADGISGATRTGLARHRAQQEAQRASWAVEDANVPKPGLFERVAIRPLGRNGEARLVLVALFAIVLLSVVSRSPHRPQETS
jgi:hypothetical protein